MTRILNFAIIFLIGGIFYVQSENNKPAITQGEQTAAVVKQDAPLRITNATLDAPEDFNKIKAAIAAKSTKTATTSALLAPNALQKAELAAIRDRFTAQRLVNSTVIVAVAPTVVAKEPATADETTNIYVVDAAVVNARSKPTTASSVLTKLRRGAKVRATGTTDGDWEQVIVSETGQSVWMHTAFLAGKT